MPEGTSRDFSLLAGLVIITIMMGALVVALLILMGGLSQRVHTGLIVGLVCTIFGIVICLILLAMMESDPLYGRRAAKVTYGEKDRELSQDALSKEVAAAPPGGAAGPTEPQPAPDKRGRRGRPQ